MADASSTSDLKLGVNGFGRIGKLTVWHHVARKYFKEIVVNIGRQAGTSLQDIAHYVQRDSTYGRLHTYLHGQKAKPVVEAVDEGGHHPHSCRVDTDTDQLLPQVARENRDRPHAPDRCEAALGEGEDLGEVALVLEAGGAGFTRHELAAFLPVERPLPPARAEEPVILHREQRVGTPSGPLEGHGVHHVVDVDDLGGERPHERVEIDRRPGP